MNIAAAGAGAGRHRVWRGGAGPGRLQASWAAAAGGGSGQALLRLQNAAAPKLFVLQGQAAYRMHK